MARTDPKTPEHRAKISKALKRYAARSDSHLSVLHDQMVEEGHPNWRGGVAPNTYRRRAFAAYGRTCNRCKRSKKTDGSPIYLLVHHRDESRKNGNIENLEVLCMGCHLRHHRGKRPGSIPASTSPS